MRVYDLYLHVHAPVALALLASGHSTCILVQYLHCIFKFLSRQPTLCLGSLLHRTGVFNIGKTKPTDDALSHHDVMIIAAWRRLDHLSTL